MNNNEGALITGSTLLTATSWAASATPWFSIAASCATITLVIFGIVNYLKTWKQQKN
jgi:hypothetical protein